MDAASLKFQVSTRDPCLCFAFRAYGGASGVFTTHLGDILGCGDRKVLHLATGNSGRRFGVLEGPQVGFAHAGVEWTQATDISAQLIREKFTNALTATPAMAELRPSRQRLLSMTEIRMRQRS